VFVGDAVGVDDGVALGVCDGGGDAVAVGESGAALWSPVFMRKASVAAAPMMMTAPRTVYVRIGLPLVHLCFCRGNN
jgi:hypothetical protein